MGKKKEKGGEKRGEKKEEGKREKEKEKKEKEKKRKEKRRAKSYIPPEYKDNTLVLCRKMHNICFF